MRDEASEGAVQGGHRSRSSRGRALGLAGWHLGEARPPTFGPPSATVMRLVLYVAAFALASSAATAQDAVPAIDPALVPFARLIGDWEGPATQRTQRGPVEMIQTERVRVELGGALLTVEGTGREVGPDGAPGDVAFHAFGVFSVDAATGTVWLDTFTQEGRHVRVQPTAVADGFDWGFDVENGPRVRYEMRFDDAGRWTEHGRVSLDGGTTWLDTFEMALDLTSEAP